MPAIDSGARFAYNSTACPWIRITIHRSSAPQVWTTISLIVLCSLNGGSIGRLNASGCASKSSRSTRLQASEYANRLRKSMLIASGFKVFPLTDSQDFFDRRVALERAPPPILKQRCHSLFFHRVLFDGGCRFPLYDHLADDIVHR